MTLLSIIRFLAQEPLFEKQGQFPPGIEVLVQYGLVSQGHGFTMLTPLGALFYMNHVAN
jgi:hypothetical protein